MRIFSSSLAGAAVAAIALPALAMPLGTGVLGFDKSGGVSAGELVEVNSSLHRRLHHSPAVENPTYGSEPYTPRPFGGYEVNQYGFGNYVGGPAGFGGYPAGSGADFVYRQQQNQKCEYAPETC